MLHEDNQREAQRQDWPTEICLFRYTRVRIVFSTTGLKDGGKPRRGTSETGEIQRALQPASRTDPGSINCNSNQQQSRKVQQSEQLFRTGNLRKLRSFQSYFQLSELYLCMLSLCLGHLCAAVALYAASVLGVSELVSRSRVATRNHASLGLSAQVRL